MFSHNILRLGWFFINENVGNIFSGAIIIWVHVRFPPRNRLEISNSTSRFVITIQYIVHIISGSTIRHSLDIKCITQKTYMVTINSQIILSVNAFCTHYIIKFQLIGRYYLTCNEDFHVVLPVTIVFTYD